MRPEFWLDRWSQGRIGFHQTKVEPCLKLFWRTLNLESGSRVFVPLCGKSLDLVWLADIGHEVFGVELSAVATEGFFTENGIPARRHAGNGFDRFEAPFLNLLCGDFFDLTPEILGDVKAVYDRAALISWAPGDRATYVEHLTAIIPKSTTILLIALEYPQAERIGPPFSVDAGEISRLFAKSHDIDELMRSDVLAGEPKMVARGISSMFEVCYRLVRRD